MLDVKSELKRTRLVEFNSSPRSAANLLYDIGQMPKPLCFNFLISKWGSGWHVIE
jgi:hypothetical protein